MKATWTMLVISAVAVACARDPQPADESQASMVIAEDRLGEITVAEVDSFILDLAPSQRWQPTAEPAQWYAAIVRRLAIDRLLLDEAVLVGSDQDPEFKVLERRILRNAYSDHFLSQLATAEPLGEEQLRTYYEDHPQRFDRQERREVSHIFKRFQTGTDRRSTLAEMAELRRRALAGESFELLARQHSDSETRHDGGRLGFVPRGRFPEDFDRVVFGLAAGVVSEAVSTADGAHLFLVTSVLEARFFAFDEVRRMIHQELESERRGELLAAASEGLPLPEERYVPGREDVVRILRTRDKTAVVLRLGDFRLTSGQLEEQLQELRRLLGARQQKDLPFKVLEEVRHREIIYQHLLRQGLPEIPQEAIDRERRRQLVQHYSRRKMTAFLERQPQRLQTHYDNNVRRFSSPLKVHVRHLVVPVGDDAPAVMGRLEQARSQLDAGRISLEDLAGSLGGKLRDLGMVTAGQLQTADPRALRFAFQLKSGEHSPPYQLSGGLVMFQVAARQEPAPRPLALVRDRVVQDYLTHYSAAVFSELSDELLTEAGFEIHGERLEEIGPIVPAQPPPKSARVES